MRFVPFLVALHQAVAASVAGAAVCEVEGRLAIEHARKRGFAFSAALTSSEGTCDATDGVTYIASATSAEDANCELRLFGQKALVAGSSITAIHVIATADGSVLFPVPDSSSVNAGWRLLVSAPKNATVQYRVDKIEITTDMDCKKWMDAF